MSYVLKDSYTTGLGDQYASTTGDYKAQSFKATSAYTINKIILKLESSSTKTKLYYVKLYLANVSGLPTGAPLATFGSFTLASLDSSCAEEEFIGGSYTVTNGNSYVIVCESSDDPDDTWRWWTEQSNNYADGVGSKKYYGGSWATAATYDRWFEVYESEETLPGKPVNPTPEDEGSGVTLHGRTVSWESGGNTDTYNVYYGTLSGFLELVEGGVEDVSTDLIEGNFDHYGEAYYWRVDAVNENGITTGDEWYFTTLIFKTPYGGWWYPDEDDPGWEYADFNFTVKKRLVATAKNTFYYEDI